ncbi:MULTISPECIES: hypothetical protein [Paraburkholderia]|uniref:Uncharacterized protein n=1 Tax=Paraburkholderia metrosideri TaxID=580937 RepID=A0ABW9E5L1_9BURK
MPKKKAAIFIGVFLLSAGLANAGQMDRASASNSDGGAQATIELGSLGAQPSLFDAGSQHAAAAMARDAIAVVRNEPHARTSVLWLDDSRHANAKVTAGKHTCDVAMELTPGKQKPYGWLVDSIKCP